MFKKRLPGQPFLNTPSCSANWLLEEASDLSSENRGSSFSFQHQSGAGLEEAAAADVTGVAIT